MKIHFLELSGLAWIELPQYADHRGFFTVRFHSQLFQEQGLALSIVQTNHSYSIPRVLRGLHYQKNPAQGKLVGVTRGKIWDVAVDIRQQSPTFGKFFGMELSHTNGKLLWIPAGFAHGFCVLGEEPADVLYQVDQPYCPEAEKGIIWNDPDLKIPWPVSHPILSEKDEKQETFAQFRKSF